MENKNIDDLRHSCAHLLAAAVLQLWPNTKHTIGPSIENGFYFDFDFTEPISENDLPKIEQKMREIVKSWNTFEKIDVTSDEALEKYKDNEYKQELIKEFSEEGKELTLYKSGEYFDLCKGGHIEKPNENLKHFKLLSIAGAYWRGDEKNKMLTRIYGIAFFTKEDLDQYFYILEEAKKRDHRKLGKELELFTFSDLVGSGLPLYLPKGALLRRLLNDLIEEFQSKEGYQQVWTPQIAKAELFKQSGHYDKYHEDMFIVKSHYSDEEMFLKPMNCPQHTQIFASKPRSYRDLPIRLTDFAMLYRDERPGQLNGLARVRSFSTDDCHVFCREDQVEKEIEKMLNMTKEVMSIFGFKYRYRLSVRDPNTPEKYHGDPKLWDKAEKWAEEIMKRNNIEHFIALGEASFYAPKMDLMATDTLGREWQLSTIQIDYVQPSRFGLTYTDNEGNENPVIMIHRAIIGSSERFLMILIEHYAGAFPVWLSPVQVEILPVSEKFNGYSQKVAEEFRKNDIRVVLNDDNKTLGAKIRQATLQKTPFMVIIGDKETSGDKMTISVRTRNGENMDLISLEDFLEQLKEKVNNKSQN